MLTSHAHAKSGGESIADAAKTLLHALRFLLGDRAAAVGGPSESSARLASSTAVLLTPDDGALMLQHVANALAALPAQQAPALLSPLLGCVCLLLTHHCRTTVTSRANEAPLPTT